MSIESASFQTKVAAELQARNKAAQKVANKMRKLEEANERGQKRLPELQSTAKHVASLAVAKSLEPDVTISDLAIIRHASRIRPEETRLQPRIGAWLLHTYTHYTSENLGKQSADGYHSTVATLLDADGFLQHVAVRGRELPSQVQAIPIDEAFMLGGGGTLEQHVDGLERLLAQFYAARLVAE